MAAHIAANIVARMVAKMPEHGYVMRPPVRHARTWRWDNPLNRDYSIPAESAEAILARIAQGDFSSPATDGETYSVVRKDGEHVADNLPHAMALRVREGFREMNPGTFYDILPCVTRHGGRDIFVGNGDLFSHDDFRNHTDGTLYDVQVDGVIVARNLSREDAERFIRESVSILDIFSAIVEFLVSPDFTFDDAMSVIHSLDFSRVYGASFIAHNPPMNDAPPPAPGIIEDWRGRENHKRVVRKMRYNAKVSEVRLESVTPLNQLNPNEIYIVLDTRDLDVVFIGGKSDGIRHIAQLVARRGDKKEFYRIVSAVRWNQYSEDVCNGKMYTLRRLSQVVAIGTQAELTDFILKMKYRTSEISISRY